MPKEKYRLRSQVASRGKKGPRIEYLVSLSTTSLAASCESRSRTCHPKEESKRFAGKRREEDLLSIGNKWIRCCHYLSPQRVE
jgi:hypothetical protein